ncbi:hypothetical protein CEXT_746061 [Caerostris extrusa]|uniref:Uncharacterized protein n=1 Tax=Caerostris extrusa TaxID=172846 RepID=A0AAV4VXG3_CAEEX|nr:hypothetical protein CEXT_746061 [Caerostris extrusa]
MKQTSDVYRNGLIPCPNCDGCNCVCLAAQMQFRWDLSQCQIAISEKACGLVSIRRISFAYIAVICYFRSVIFIEVTVIAMTNTKCGSSTTLDVVPSRACVLT